MTIFKSIRWSKLKSLATITIGGSLTFSAICIYSGNQQFHENILMPAIHLAFNPEQAHRFAIWTAKFGLLPQSKFRDSNNILELTLWGLKFKTPVGIAAGFDKDGEAVAGLFKTGIGFLEVGSVTPLPQDGNPKPRIFRLAEDRAIINRCGFNSKGHEYVRNQLKYFNKEKGILGVNLGKNKTSDSAEKDYASGVTVFKDIADYIVINVSSPNTPGLRDLQMKISLEKVLDEVFAARDNDKVQLVKISLNSMKQNKKKVPIIIKIAPDLTFEEKKSIAQVAQRKGKEVDGIVVSNTTISRPSSLLSLEKTEEGGLSGKPLSSLSTQVIRDMYKLTNGKVPIIGVGGISSGKDAYEKIRAGASLIQLYSSLIYSGPPLIERINKELMELVVSDGFKNITEAVGAEHQR